jgi:hypothetical protein
VRVPDVLTALTELPLCEERVTFSSLSTPLPAPSDTTAAAAYPVVESTESMPTAMTECLTSVAKKDATVLGPRRVVMSPRTSVQLVMVAATKLRACPVLASTVTNPLVSIRTPTRAVDTSGTISSDPLR